MQQVNAFASRLPASKKTPENYLESLLKKFLSVVFQGLFSICANPFKVKLSLVEVNDGDTNTVFVSYSDKNV
jgi:hypothetical protein